MGMTPTRGSYGNRHRTARIHSHAWRRDDRVAARGAGAAGRAGAAHRRAHECHRRRRSAFARNQGTREPQWLKLSVFLSVSHLPAAYFFELPNILERMWLFPPQPMISLGFLRFWCCDYERSRELFVPVLISLCALVGVELSDRIHGDFRVSRQVMRRENGLNVARFV